MYSAGIVLYELLTGEAPYVGESAMAVAFQHVHSRVPAPSSRVGANPPIPTGVPRQLDELVLRVTDSDPGGRPLDAGAFLAELHDVRADLGLPIVAVPARPRPAPATRSGVTAQRPVEAPAGQHVTERMQLGAPFAGAGRHDTTVAPSQYPPRQDPSRPGAPRPTNPARQPPSQQTRPHPSAPVPVAPNPVQQRHGHPARRALIVLLVILLLGAAAGFGGWWYVSGRYKHVPNVGGEASTTAVAALRNAGLDHVTLRKAFSETVATGTVISSAPDAGSRTLPSHTVTLVVSSGKERFTVPDVHGQAQSAAQAALAKIPVQITASQQSSDTVAKGTVLGTTPAAGTQVKRDQAVTIVVSSGPPVIDIPQVQGEDQDSAQSTLSDAGFTVTVTQAYSDTVSEGDVISTSPAGGDQAVKFSTITLVVSQGSQPITVPQIAAGTNADDARSQLTDLGLKVKVRKQFGAPLNIVVGLDPVAGSQVHRGDTITLFVD